MNIVAPPTQSPAAKPTPKKAAELPIFERRNWLIHLHYVRKEFATCKDVIRQQLAESHGVCEYAVYVKGLILRLEGKISESLEQFQTCVLLNPSSVDNYKQVARSLFLLARHKAAIDVYDEAKKMSDRDWEIAHNKGVCYMYLKELDKAKECLTEALSYKNNDLSHIMLGKIYLAEGNMDMAIDVYKKAVENSPENVELLSTLGLLYMQKGQYQVAFEHLGNSLTFDPSNVKSILAAGFMLQLHTDYDVALNNAECIEEEDIQLSKSDLKPSSVDLTAISCLKRANYFCPFEWKILFNLGLVHMTMQQYASAFHFLSAAVNLKPRMGSLFSMLAVSLFHLDDVANAKQAHEQAVKLDSDDPLICLNYAVFLYNTGDRMAAARQLSSYEKRLSSGNISEPDPEMIEMAQRLGASIHVGESLVGQVQQQKVQQQQQQPQTSN